MAASTVAPQARIVEAATLDSAVEASGASDLILMLLDLKMPGSAGYSGVALLHAERPSVPILVVSSAQAQVAGPEARRYGAVGFIGKDQDLETIEQAIAAALAGDAPPSPPPPVNDAVDDMAGKVASLTPTQLRVLLGVLDGQLNKQIAYELGVAESTIKSHMTIVLSKLGVQNRTQAALAARALGLQPRD